MTRTAVRMYSRLIIVNPEFRSYFSESPCPSGIFILENYPLPGMLADEDTEKLQKQLYNLANGFGKQDTAERIIKLAKETFAVKEDIEGYLRYIQYQLEEYKFLREKVSDIRKEIRKEASKDYCKKEIETMEIRGVGIEVRAGILSELGDIKNFDKISSIVRFAGMIVLKNQSGKTEGHSKMSKQGSSYLRNYLHLAAMGAKLHTATFAAVYANKCMKVKDLDPESKRVARRKLVSNLARRMLETIAVGLMKNRLFNDKIAFEAIQIDDFIRETISVQFKNQLAQSVVQ